jgi:predicted transcriptional regulator
MKEIDLHVGYAPAVTKKRVLAALRRARAGETVGERHVTFETWEVLARTLSGKRLELLRQVRQQPAASVAALARAVGRDYKRVHEDVEILTAAGLLERADGGGVRAGYDEIRASINLLSPAA